LIVPELLPGNATGVALLTGISTVALIVPELLSGNATGVALLTGISIVTLIFPVLLLGNGTGVALLTGISIVTLIFPVPFVTFEMSVWFTAKPGQTTPITKRRIHVLINNLIFVKPTPH
jgi:hypothetical protein